MTNNQLLRDDNDRMKRILNNNSNNSSLPPSSDQVKASKAEEKDNNDDNNTPGSSGKSANRYNGRTGIKKKKGGQPWHTGTTLTRAFVEEKIRDGVFRHSIKHIGKKSHNYVSRYVTYGSNIRAMTACLYSEGVVSNDRICSFINSITNNALDISEKSIYQEFQQRHFCFICGDAIQKAETDEKNRPVKRVCRDSGA